MIGNGVIIRRIARLLSTLVYREIDVRVDPELGPGGPVIAVANHFGGLADAVLLVDSMPTMPRIVARDAIWKVPVAGTLMTVIGGIPVHQRVAGERASNDQMFGSCYQALAQSSTILIFPEGVTQDAPHIAPVKTGAARIALGARSSGVSGIRIVAVGVHYEDKAVFRSRVLVNAGPPLDVDAWAQSRGLTDGADNREAVDDLTSEITAQLRAVAPDYPDWPTATAYGTAAEIPLNDIGQPDDPVRYGDVQLLAGLLRRADHEGSLAAAAGHYRGDLALLRTSEEAVARHDRQHDPQRSPARLRDLLVSLVLLPYALIGAIVALVPWLLVQAVRLVPAAPAVRATLTPGVALLAFGFEWFSTTWAMWDRAGPRVGAATFLLIPFFLAAAVYVAERFTVWWRQRNAARLPPSQALAGLLEQRSRLATQAWEML